ASQSAWNFRLGEHGVGNHENGTGSGSGGGNGSAATMRRSFSKSASDLLHRSRTDSIERVSGDSSPQGSPPLSTKNPERLRPSIFTTLKTKFKRTTSRDGKINMSRRKDILADGLRSNSHPDVSSEHQDSGTEYGADGSSAEQSSCATPLNMSPLRGSLLSQTRQQSQDLDCDVTGPEIFDCGLPTSPLARRDSNDAQMHNRDDTSNSLADKASSSGTNEVWSVQDPNEARKRELRQFAFFQLHVHLKRGTDLVARDTCGTSDPYVKFKVNGKLVYKSKTVYKELNPSWDETFSTHIEDVFEPVIIKVFDYDWGLQDDFMGMARLDLTALDLNTTEDLTIYLIEPNKETPEGSMGSITLTVNLIPKTQEDKDQEVRNYLDVILPQCWIN
ncbi:unnamed protein product, partial [Meganyctiphanes norvegica]